MKVKRNYNRDNKVYQYELEQAGNKMLITYGGNLDLYFSYYKKNRNSIVIDKENMTIYNIFNDLYYDVKNCNVFDVDPIQKEFCETEEELKRLEDENKELNRSTRYIQEELFKKNIIKWISDDSYEESDYNSVIIKKEEGNIIISFNLNDELNRSVRISNSGSRYNPYNIIFMRMFNKLLEYDPECHQMTIDEYNYNLREDKVLKLT